MKSRLPLPFLTGDSVMARMMREHDWSGSALGPPQQWPQSLRSVVQLMLGSAFPMFIAWGPQLAQLYNDAYIAVMGDKHPAALAQPLLENWAEIRADLEPLVAQALRGDAPYFENLPLRMQRGSGDGEDTWFTFSYSPIQNDEGEVAGMFCACIETTKTVLAERRQQAERQWLENLLQQAPGFTAVLRGPDHVFEMVNQAYFQLTGNRDLIGKPLAQALPEVIGQGFDEWLDQTFKTGEPFVGRSIPVMLNRDPNAPMVEAFIDFIYQPLKNVAGQIEGIFVQGHEVTEQHRAREALTRADRQKDEFLATLAHELRNPLAPICTAVQLLTSPRATDAVRRQAADVIGRQVGQMSRLLDDLIDIARITQKRMALKKELISVQSLVVSALEAARPYADAKRHVLTAEVVAPQALLQADPVRVTQVLSNLLNNAAKYTDPGGQILLDVREEADVLVFGVTDNGIGLDAAAIENIFLMFAQEKSALDRSDGGLGIGLALSKGLVELHGGTLAVESAGLGHGSRFEVRLPSVHRDTVSQPDTAEDPPRAVSAPVRRVLLADDNRDLADTLGELLRMDGHLVRIANDGNAAAALALDWQPDVLVLDIGMPGLNGYEVARTIRAQPWGDRPLLIAATGWGKDDDRRRAKDAGFDLHLTKPFDPAHLSSLILGQADG